jgi:hypothetical protein
MTDMITSVGAILKIDEAGRVRTPAARREVMLDEFERSGLSGAKFATLAGIKYQTLAGWVRKRRGQRDASSTDTVKAVASARWLEAVVEPAQNPGGPNPTVMVLQLPGGVRVEVADEKQVVLAAALVKALAKSC